MSNERYVNTPLDPEVFDALATAAKEHGRNPGRELSQIAKRALCRKGRNGAKGKKEA